MPFGEMRERGGFGEDTRRTKRVWDKEYKVFNIVSPKTLNEFAEEYLVKERPEIIGIDSEAAIDQDGRNAELKMFGYVRYSFNKATVLQLATSNFLCLIDVQVLSKRTDMDNGKWKSFFEKLFDPDITIVGFSLHNDFKFLYAQFPFIRPILQDRKKMLCLSKLSDEIRKNQVAFEIVFNKVLPCDKSLATLANMMLNIKMDKTYQSMDWTIRPLSDDQKDYAVKDALIVLLIKDKILYHLESKMGVDDAREFMKKGYMNMAKMKFI